MRMRKLLRKIFVWARAAIGVCIAVVGLAGIPDDVATWSRWIDNLMYDPIVIALAERAVAVADFLNQNWVRGALVFAGVLMMIWPLRWFWRLRHRLKFKVRHLLAEQVWISRDDAVKVIKASPWGRLCEPNVVKSVTVFESLAQTWTRDRIIYGMSDVDKALLRYTVFVERTLESFCNANPTACRVNEGDNEIDETALKAFLEMAIDEDIKNEFGNPPDYKVT